MHTHKARKQIPSLRKTHLLARSDTKNILRRYTRPMRTSGIIIAGITTVAGVSSLAFALQHENIPHSSVKNTSNSSVTAPGISTESSSSISIEASSQPVAEDPLPSSSPSSIPEPTITGNATINGESIPLTQGTVERTFTDSSGTQHSVSISIDGQSTVVESNSSSTNTNISIDSHSSSSTDDTRNITRGSPRR